MLLLLLEVPLALLDEIIKSGRGRGKDRGRGNDGHGRRDIDDVLGSWVV